MSRISHNDFPQVLSNLIATYLRTREITSFFNNSATDYWIQRSRSEFKISEEEFKNTILSPEERYIQLLTLQGNLTGGSEKYVPFHRENVTSALRNGDIDLARYFNSKADEDDPFYAKVQQSEYLQDKETMYLYMLWSGVDPFILAEYIGDPNEIADLLFSNCPSEIPRFLMRYHNRLSPENLETLRSEEAFVFGDKKGCGINTELSCIFTAAKLNFVSMFDDLTRDLSALSGEEKESLTLSLSNSANLEFFNIFVRNTGLGRDLILQVAARDAVRNEDLKTLTQIVKESGNNSQVIYASCSEAREKFRLTKKTIFLDIIRYLISLKVVDLSSLFGLYFTAPISLLQLFVSMCDDPYFMTDLEYEARHYPLLLSVLLDHNPSESFLSMITIDIKDNKYARDILLRSLSKRK